VKGKGSLLPRIKVGASCAEIFVGEEFRRGLHKVAPHRSLLELPARSIDIRASTFLLFILHVHFLAARPDVWLYSAKECRYRRMATTTETSGSTTIREINDDRIDKGAPLTHTTTNISLSPELFEKVTFSSYVFD
jgi:hypothetical protein